MNRFADEVEKSEEEEAPTITVVKQKDTSVVESKKKTSVIKPSRAEEAYAVRKLEEVIEEEEAKKEQPQQPQYNELQEQYKPPQPQYDADPKTEAEAEPPLDRSVVVQAPQPPPTNYQPTSPKSHTQVISVASLHREEPQASVVRPDIVSGKCDKLRCLVDDFYMAGFNFKESQLPQPVVTLTSLTATSVRVSWGFRQTVTPKFRLALCVVNAVGARFEPSVRSDIRCDAATSSMLCHVIFVSKPSFFLSCSFECSLASSDGELQPATRHQWNLIEGSNFDVTGLCMGHDYE